jgi:chromosome segregation ATPase
MKTLELNTSEAYIDTVAQLAAVNKTIEVFSLRPGADAKRTVNEAFTKRDQLELERDSLESFEQYAKRKGSITLLDFADQDAFTRRDVTHFHERDRREGAVQRHTRELRQANDERIAPAGPSVSELESQLDNIREQLRHWQSIESDAKGNVDDLKKRVDAANEIIKLLSAEKRLNKDEREDIQDANETLARIAPDLQTQEARLKNAKSQIATWNERNKAFDHDTYGKLKAAEARRRRLKA